MMDLEATILCCTPSYAAYLGESLKERGYKPEDNSRAVDPYTRTRVILMNGTEFEAVWYGHQFSRHTADNELRRQVALLRRLEQQQQKLVAAQKNKNQIEGNKD